MFKLIDEIWALIGYFVAAVFALIAISVSFTFYPVISSIVFGCLCIAPFLPLLEKVLERLARKLEVCNQQVPKTSFKDIQDAFKQGLKKGMK